MSNFRDSRWTGARKASRNDRSSLELQRQQPKAGGFALALAVRPEIQFRRGAPNGPPARHFISSTPTRMRTREEGKSDEKMSPGLSECSSSGEICTFAFSFVFFLQVGKRGGGVCFWAQSEGDIGRENSISSAVQSTCSADAAADASSRRQTKLRSERSRALAIRTKTWATRS